MGGFSQRWVQLVVKHDHEGEHSALRQGRARRFDRWLPRSEERLNPQGILVLTTDDGFYRGLRPSCIFWSDSAATGD
jgi:hypothetical protein